jgi:putative ABC transport system permease protein
MAILESIGQFVQDLRTQRLRTTLTILGIAWGTIAVVVLLAFGVGLEKQSRKNMHGMGNGVVVVFPGLTTIPFEGFPDGRRISLVEADVATLRAQIPYIGQISAEYTRRVPMRRGRSTTTPTVTGIYPEYGDMRNIIPEAGGRFLNPIDEAQRRRVVVLGDEIDRLLFGEEDAIGRQVMVGDTPFTVIGVMQKKTQNSSYNTRDQDRVFIPASTFKSIFGDRYINNLIYRPVDPDRSPAIKASMFEILGRKHRFDSSDNDALGVWDTNQMDKMMKYFFIGFNVFMGIIGSFTLTVGGIGVANIMYVVVRERTREIGIKRSVGATRRSILAQFFAETLTIVGTGALIGFVAAVGLVELLGMLPVEDYVGTPRISGMVAATTVLLLIGIAILAGYFPARRASRLDPVDCLRG